ncbi:NAD(P)-dependent oxidoreductase [Rhodovibrionaceae bacterium A322]
MTKIAFLGLGAMGERMAKRLLEAGHEVTLYNRTRSRCQPLVAKGGKCAESPQEAVKRADVVFSMLRDDAACQAVWLAEEGGALAGLNSGCLVLECSTVTPHWIDRLGQAVLQKGGHLLDAPVAGSRPQAEAGQLIFLLGGEKAQVAAASPLLSQLGSKALHVGPLGSGITLKLALNALFALQVAAVGELLPFLQRSGLSASQSSELLGQTPVVSAAAQGAMAQMVSEAFAPLFPIDLVEKDLTCVLQAGAALNQPLPVTAALQQLFRQAKDQGLGDKNISGITLLHRPSPGHHL